MEPVKELMKEFMERADRLERFFERMEELHRKWIAEDEIEQLREEAREAALRG